jgi:hypothetical protein
VIGSRLTLKFIQLPLHLIHHLLQLLELRFQLLNILRLLLLRGRRLLGLSWLGNDRLTPDSRCNKQSKEKDRSSSHSAHRLPASWNRLRNLALLRVETFVCPLASRNN